MREHVQFDQCVHWDRRLIYFPVVNLDVNGEAAKVRVQVGTQCTWKGRRGQAFNRVEAGASVAALAVCLHGGTGGAGVGVTIYGLSGDGWCAV